MIKGIHSGPVRSNVRDLAVLIAEFNGRGASNGACPPVARSDGANVTKGFTLTRTGAGLYTLVYLNGSIPFVVYREGEVLSATAASVYFLTETATTGTWTLQILNASAAAFDPGANDIIQLRISAANAGQP